MENESGYIRGWIDHYQFDNAAFSDYFVEQLEFIHKNRRYNVFSIIDEIKYLERKSTITATKNEESFKYDPLKKFWHKHHFQAGFIPRNILNYWQLENPESKRFNQLWNKLVAEPDTGEIDAAFLNKLTYEMVHKAFFEHIQKHKLTGEWIVFAKHNGKNYYLALARHGEGDNKLYERLTKNCRQQFPFLFDKIS